jgi:hypothetical protein
MSVTDVNFNPSKNTTVHDIKTKVLELERLVEQMVPPGRRRSIAMTKLEDFSMWAVKAAAVGDD